jgi:hypothetical protein
MRALFTVTALFAFTSLAFGYGSIPWEWVHKEIQAEDKALLEFVERTFDISPSGGCMRPISGEHAGKRFAPYEFQARLKGEKGDYAFKLTFEQTGRDDKSWSVQIETLIPKTKAAHSETNSTSSGNRK